MSCACSTSRRASRRILEAFEDGGGRLPPVFLVIKGNAARNDGAAPAFLTPYSSECRIYVFPIVLDFLLVTLDAGNFLFTEGEAHEEDAFILRSRNCAVDFH